MEDKYSDNKSTKSSDDVLPAGIEDKNLGKISTSTTTTSLYTEDEQESPEAVPETVPKIEKPKNVSHSLPNPMSSSLNVK